MPVQTLSVFNSASNGTGTVRILRPGDYVLGIKFAAAGSVLFEWQDVGGATWYPCTDENGTAVFTASRSPVIRLGICALRATASSLTGNLTIEAIYCGD